MKLKTSAIAMAVAGIVAAPMAVQADSGFYGSVRIGLIYTDTGGSDEIQVKGVSSRFGFRNETDMGNGLTAFGRYEFSVSTEGASTLGRRHAYVGLKGDFGKVTLGQTYHTYYNFVVGPLDNPWRGSGFTMLSYTGRTAQAISYASDFGAVGVGATLYMDGSGTSSAGKAETVDGYEFAAGMDAGPIRLALGYQLMGVDESTGPSAEPTIGFTASGWEIGGITLGASYAMQGGQTGVSSDATSIVLDLLGPGGFYAHYEMLDIDAAGAPAPSIITVGYTQSLGRQTTAYYEYYQVDADTGVSNDDETSLAAVLKYNWK